jgi:DNA processing protein
METTTIDTTESPYAAVFEGIMPAVSKLHVASNNLDDLLSRPRVAIVGSRKITPYGRMVTEQFSRILAQAGVVIVSGLAYGVDACAHQAVLDAGGLTIAVLPMGMDKIYPRVHHNLATQIVEQGGALITEYEDGVPAFKWNFIERNRIVSGMSDVLLITEAAINSGTMHTARFALEQGKDVMTIPGNITSPTSAGTNHLIRMGANPALSPEDVLSVLGIRMPEAKAKPAGANPQEQCILNLLEENISDGSELLSKAALPIELFNQTLTMLEITGKVRATGNNSWVLS